MPRRRRRPSQYWHEPEYIEGQAERDAQLGRTEFFVYVLETDRGHYVGHTWNVASRLRDHQRDEVESTAGANPRLLWQSSIFSTRDAAARVEAALKTWRDQEHPRYREITGLNPNPFHYERARPGAGAGSGCIVTLATAAAITIATTAIMLL